MALAEIATIFIVLILVIVVSSFPLYLAVKMLGGETTLLAVLVINVIMGIITALLEYKFAVIGSGIAFLLLIFVYKFAFKMGWLKVIFAWILQFVIIIIIFFILINIGVIASGGDIKWLEYFQTWAA